MNTARRLVVLVALVALSHGGPLSAAPPGRDMVPDTAPMKRVAGIVSAYYHNSHADVILGRMLATDTLDGKGRTPRMQLASLLTDQVPENDISRKLAQQHGFPICTSVEQALTLGTGKLAVDGVFLIMEHGKYPLSPTEAIIYPKRKYFEQIARVFEKYGRAVPIFVDKHLCDNWQDAKWMYDTAQRLKIPMMAGSSLPGLWRIPAEDVARDERLTEIVAVSYHLLDVYGFHAIEMVQSLAEQRHGGETGIKSVQTLTGKAVWQAEDAGQFDRELLAAAIARLTHPHYNGKDLRKRVMDPKLCRIDYNDGLKATILTLDGAVGEWSVAWRRTRDRGVQSTLFDTQEYRPLMHFAYLFDAVERMVHSQKPYWPIERTLLTSGALDALLQSKQQGGRLMPTPHLVFPYRHEWRWREPPPRPPNRPLTGQ